MAVREAEIWMWSQACDMLARAERLHRQFFQLQRSRQAPAWEPPADVLETEREVVVLLALPGVSPDRVEAAIEDGELVVSGVRVLPPELRDALIYRLELPQGRFERRLPLPPGRYSGVEREFVYGCLQVRLRKMV
ncbi:MAG: Hsp20/alpha crystallin family protein [Variibacter sp.]|nr:Hsp20/alpha crystallin family protein [Variibacter sp.]